MADKAIAEASGVGFWGLLSVALIVLKLVGVISIGWFGILFIIIGLPICLVVLVIGGYFAFIHYISEK